MSEAYPPIPSLRFPEFRDNGPWGVKPLGALVNTITPPKKIQTSGYSPSGRFPVIDQSPNDICGWTDDETALVQADFPLVIFGDHTCVVKVAEGPFAQGADGIKILAPSSDVEARFLHQYLQANPLEQDGYRRHFSALKEKLISFPPLETGEQQKIADCLTSLDKLIRAETAKLESLKMHKAGLIQWLFPARGETCPRVRFPEFRESRPWEMKRLDEILVEHGQKSTGEQDVFSVSVRKGLVDQIEHLGRRFAAESTDHYNLVQPGDIVYTKSPTGEFPLGIIKKNQNPFSVTVSPLYGVFSPLNEHIGVILDAYFESPERALLFLDPLVQKGAKNTINVKNESFLSGEICLPPSEDERRKIADCLTSLDELITAQDKMTAALGDHKRGLLQQLFPRGVI